MRRLFHWPQTLAIAAILLPAAALAQARGQWHLVGSDQAHDNWQATESKLSPESVQSNFKLLWKLKLGEDRAPQSFSEMLFTPSMITSHGFKDMGVWGDSDTLYAVDYALGTIFWKKKFTIAPAHGCAPEKMQLLMEPPHVIHFGAKSSGTAQAAPPPPPPPPADQRWIGAPTQGGGFGLKGIYAVTSDGILHEQNLANGSDFAPSVLLLPGASDTISALNMDEKVLYAETRGGCGHDGNTLWSIDLNSSAHTSNNAPIDNASLLDRTGVAISSDGTVYTATLATRKDMSPPSRLRNVTAFSAKDLKILDWYVSVQPEKTTELNLSPIVLRYNERELVAASGGGGIVLLDAKSLGGDDHHTPLAQSAKIAKSTQPDAWEALASWHEKDGTTWLLASISGPVEPSVQFADTNGPAEHGSIIAFKVEESNGQLVLAPQWISRDLRNPAPPVIANGVVFALSGGDAGSHAVLYALDAQTGKELYSSGNAITAPSHLAGVSVGDGHVFFTTQDNTLYSFGIPMEH